MARAAPGSVSSRGSDSAVGRVNGWCSIPALEIGVPLEHREVGDPGEPPHVLVDEPEFATELQAEKT